MYAHAKLSLQKKKKKRERGIVSKKLLNNLLPNRLRVNSVHPGLNKKKKESAVSRRVKRECMCEFFH